MKFLLAGLLSVFLYDPVSAHSVDVDVEITALETSCKTLQEVIAAHGGVFVIGLGSRNVYADFKAACVSEGIDDGYSFQTYWQTRDTTACRAGFGCRAYRDSSDDDLGDDDIPGNGKNLSLIHI